MRWITAVPLTIKLFCKAYEFKHEVATSNLIDMMSDELWSLLPQGEGQDEGSKQNIELCLMDPLTPTLSLWERGLTGQQWRWRL